MHSTSSDRYSFIKLSEFVGLSDIGVIMSAFGDLATAS